MSKKRYDSSLPLDGLLVVSVEQAVAAPFASRQLGDLGARVIKIERRDGGDFARGYDDAVGGLSSYFVWLNRGKESVVADLKDADDREFVERLVSRADVFIQNLGPGAADRLGLGASQLHERYPRLISCDVSGYGEAGPYRDRKAYDLLIQSEAGLVAVTGSPSDPAKAGISVADIAAGMYTYSGILAALYERERTGWGTHLHVSLFDSLGEWMGAPMYFGRYRGQDPPRTGASHATIAPYGPFRTADGSLVTIGVQNSRDWRALCGEILHSERLLEDESYATNAQRVSRRPEMEELISAELATREASELVAELAAAGLAYGIMRGAGELMEHPQVVERSRLRSVASSAGQLDALLPPVIWPRRELAMGAIPDLGEHDAAIRTWVATTPDRV